MAFFAAAMIDREAYSRLALRNFDENEAVVTHPKLQAAIKPVDSGQVDFTLWSPERIQAYRGRIAATKVSPLAVLRLARLDLRAPVFTGTDELTLNRGVGWIAGTARPGEAGNIGIAGHRDSFFRRLKDISIGDTIELDTAQLRATYIVDHIEVVQPNNVSVLRPGPVASITLTTCYPFYMIGPAPQRFIVHAALKEQVEVGSLSTVPPQREPNS